MLEITLVQFQNLFKMGFQFQQIKEKNLNS
ncbi:MAG: hypothetical protein ACI94Y_001424 [Maribacter sp.]|jgi:hypothetical protein